MVVEIIQKGGATLVSAIADLFTDVIKTDILPPEYGNESRLRVLFKKGDLENPSNYRPITLLPILYKLFARVLCGRIGPIIDQQQPKDQAGFRTGYSCEDHHFTMVQLVETHAEYHVN